MPLKETSDGFGFRRPVEETVLQEKKYVKNPFPLRFVILVLAIGAMLSLAFVTEKTSAGNTVASVQEQAGGGQA